MKICHIVTVLAVVIAGAAANKSQAVDPKLTHRAIERGTAALRTLQAPDGTWQTAGYVAGMTSLAALTLLECGATPDDMAVQRAADAVRQAAAGLIDTYSLALAILFLDRLGDPADAPIIQVLGIRLMYGQRPSGAWGYTCPYVGGQTETTLVAQTGRPAEPRRKDAITPGNSPGNELPADIKSILATYAALGPEAARSGQLAQVGRPRRGPLAGIEDHSNTQFATLGLWIARRHGIPVEGAIKAIDNHYRRVQNADGGWGYVEGEASTPTMTAAGILGLAVGDGTGTTKRDAPGQRGAAVAGRDKQLHKALVALGTAVGRPAGAPAMPPPGPGGGRGRGPQAWINRGPHGDGTLYYLLWSVERVAMCLELRTISRKDWYSWGANILLTRQGQDGQWRGHFTEGGADTCFAMLFLCRSNLIKDLTARLHGQFRDPGQVTLRSNATSDDAETTKTTKPTKPFIQPPNGVQSAAPASPASTPLPHQPASRTPDPRASVDLPAVAAPAAATPAVQPVKPSAVPASSADPAATLLAEKLASANASQFDNLLGQVRDAKGVVNTEALAAAIPKLTRDSKKKAREALAQRLSHMRTSTLANYLKDQDAEIRRGAALALAMKESKENIPDLINLLSDGQQSVVLAARSALKELTGKDYGPAPNASAEDRHQAVADWWVWWKSSQKR